MAQIPSDALRAWRDFCEQRALYRSTLVEVIGYWLVAHPDHPLAAEWVERARELAADRNRGRPRD